MTRSEALLVFAAGAIQSTSHEPKYCVIPSSLRHKTFYNIASDVVAKEFTHYARKWKDDNPRKGIVVLDLYKGDAFGACVDLEYVGTEEVELPEL
jgi:hypothetical protein